MERNWILDNIIESRWESPDVCHSRRPHCCRNEGRSFYHQIRFTGWINHWPPKSHALSIKWNRCFLLSPEATARSQSKSPGTGSLRRPIVTQGQTITAWWTSHDQCWFIIACRKSAPGDQINSTNRIHQASLCQYRRQDGNEQKGREQFQAYRMGSNQKISWWMKKINF